MKKYYFTIIIATVLFLVSTIKFVLLGAGIISDGIIRGFAVDTTDNIYIGKKNVIEVYHNGILFRTIKPPTSREYRFYYEEGQLIIGCATDSGAGKIYDLSGNFIKKSDLNYEEIKYEAKKRTRIVQNGDEYELKRNVIFCNGQELYRMSAAEYFFNGIPFWVISIVSVLGLFFSVILVISDMNLHGTDWDRRLMRKKKGVNP